MWHILKRVCHILFIGVFDMSVVNFYKLSDDFRKINKTLKNPFVKDCNIRTDIDIYNPVLLLQDYDNIYDYFEWDENYYFITSVIYMSNKIWRITSHIDVLMSYKTELMMSRVRTVESDNIDIYYDGGDYQSLVKKEIDVYDSNVTLPTNKDNVLVGVGSAS